MGERGGSEKYFGDFCAGSNLGDADGGEEFKGVDAAEELEMLATEQSVSEVCPESHNGAVRLRGGGRAWRLAFPV